MARPRPKKTSRTSKAKSIEKCPTGITGLDEVTGGGLPQGRPTLVCGTAGCGKTLVAATFLVNGVVQYNEPGVFMTFEERTEDLEKNFASLGFDLPALEEQNKLAIDHVHVERSEIEETGEYDLEGLFVRLAYAIDSVKAKRVVLDTIETLFAGLGNPGILRAELRRLFGWLKDRGMTAIITAERGEGTLTRHGLEEYVSDCVILLDHRVENQISTRRVRVVKYRGSSHGTNEYPFIINEQGIQVMPITSVGMDYQVSSERISTGIPRLDTMMNGKGFYRGSSILISGTAGSGKTSFCGAFVDEACARGERCLYFAFEESPHQIMRNLRSVGIDLERHVKKGLLRFHAVRPNFWGLETHLAYMHSEMDRFQPHAVIVDPISNLINVSQGIDVHIMLLRLIDYAKSRAITGIFTNLSHGKEMEQTEAAVSSLMDTWLLLSSVEEGGERNRRLHILKSRGMEHSNQMREFRFTSEGIELTDVYVGMGGVLTGSARLAQEAADREAELNRRQEMARKQRELTIRERALQAKIAALQAEFAAEKEEIQLTLSQEETREAFIHEDQQKMATSRYADPAKVNNTLKMRKKA